MKTGNGCGNWIAKINKPKNGKPVEVTKLSQNEKKHNKITINFY